MAVISLENMMFRSNHGCFAEERTIGTDFLVDVRIQADTSAAQLDDEITSTINYQELYNVVAYEMSKPSHLIEHVAERILSSIFSSFPAITWGHVKVSKLNPPLGGQLYSASVVLERKRSE